MQTQKNHKYPNPLAYIAMAMLAAVVVVFLVILIVAVLAPPAHAAESCYSDGVRVGVVQKLSSKGVFVKSWEGEMVMEGVRARQATPGAPGAMTNIWRFSVTDPAVAGKIIDAVFAGGAVQLRYCQSFLNNPIEASTSYRVTAIAPRPQR